MSETPRREETQETPRPQDSDDKALEAQEEKELNPEAVNDDEIEGEEAEDEDK